MWRSELTHALEVTWMDNRKFEDWVWMFRVKKQCDLDFGYCVFGSSIDNASSVL